MIRPGADRRLQRPPPVVVALPRRAVDQVQADVVEPGRARPSHALFWSPGLVLAVKRAQHVRYRALHSERDPGDSLRPQFPEGGGVDGFRVRLDRDFRVTGQAEGLADPGEDAAEPRRGEQRRGAAAEEHRAHRGFARRKNAGGDGDLACYQVRVGVLRGAAAEFGRGVGVEVAIAAAGPAERDVHVHAERLLAVSRGRARRQAPVGGNWLTVREGSRHAAEDKL